MAAMPIYGLNLLISLGLETMYVASGAWYTYQVCSNDDIGLLLDFLWQIKFALVTAMGNCSEPFGNISLHVLETFSVKLCHSQSKMAMPVTLPNFENKSLVIIYNVWALNP